MVEPFLSSFFLFFKDPSSTDGLPKTIVPICTTLSQVHMRIFASLAKEVMFLVALVCLFVCLFVCLSVDNITQKVMNGLG